MKQSKAFLDNLRMLQLKFEGIRRDQQADYKELEKIQKDFTKRFTPEKILQLELDDYVLGKQIDGDIDQDTFCYWVEWKTVDLGRIQGSTAYKFGIFVSKHTGEYRFKKQFATPEEAWSHIKKQIYQLVHFGEQEDYPNIEQVDISPMFKGKILFLYYPEKYLNIFSEEHLNHFLNCLNLLDTETSKLSILDKRKALMDFKNADAVMQSWTTLEFAKFLYESFGRPSKKEEISPELKEYADLDEDYAKIEDVQAEFVDFTVKEIPVKEETSSKSFKGVVDFERENRIHKKLGNRGELVVFNAEKNFLKSKGKPELAEKVDWVSKRDDSEGYDIRSFDDEGIPIYIEVKSTNSSPGNANFLISSNQYSKAESLKGYYIYMVFNAKTEHPKIWKIKNFLSYKGAGVNITPISFRVNIGAGQIQDG